MDVPFQDFPALYEQLKPELDEAYHRVMRSGRYIAGPEVEAFEAEFAAYIGVRHCVSVGNGLDALTLTLKALGVGGETVRVPDKTFYATWLAVSHAGGQPVLDGSTRVELVTHLYGIPDPRVFTPFATIEDCAQAAGATLGGRKVGSLGLAGCFSFYPTKPLGCYGDGGAVTTDSDELAASIRLLRDYTGRGEVLNHNTRLDELQAAFLRVRLKHLDAHNKRRREIAARYWRVVEEERWIYNSSIPARAVPAFYQFSIRTEWGGNRRAAAILRERGIETMIHYGYTPGETSIYKGVGQTIYGSEWALRCVSLPIYPTMTDEQVEYVCKALKEYE